MPIMDGYRATSTIRSTFSEDPVVRSTPIVAMTASAIHGDREKCQIAGMDDYLAKPVKKVNLEKMLVKWAVEGRKKRAKIQSNPGRQDSRPANARTSSTFTDNTQTPQEQLASQVDRLSFAEYKIEHHSKSAGDRALLHQENEERAISLRNDALLESGGDPRRQLGRGLSDGSQHRVPEPTSANALTAENMHEFDQGLGRIDPLKRFKREDSGEDVDSTTAATFGDDASAVVPSPSPSLHTASARPSPSLSKRPG